MSGTGKSTALDKLGRRGFRVVDTDVGRLERMDARDERVALAGEPDRGAPGVERGRRPLHLGLHVEPGEVLRPLRRGRAAQRSPRGDPRARDEQDDEKLRQAARGARPDPLPPRDRGAAAPSNVHPRARREQAARRRRRRARRIGQSAKADRRPVFLRRVRSCACACGRDASSASRTTATKLRNVGSGQWTSAAPSNQEGSTRKTTAVITTLPNHPMTRNSVASTMPQKPSSGRPTAAAKSSTFQASQKITGPIRSTTRSAASATTSPPATSAPIPRTRRTVCDARTHTASLRHQSVDLARRVRRAVVRLIPNDEKERR